MYDCLTSQLNVTLRPREGTAKWILALRDPTPGFRPDGSPRQIELSREGGQCAWVNLSTILGAATARLCEGLLYLGGLPGAQR